MLRDELTFRKVLIKMKRSIFLMMVLLTGLNEYFLLPVRSILIKRKQEIIFTAISDKIK